MLRPFATLFVLLCFVITGCAAQYSYAQTPVKSAAPAKPKAIVKIKKKAVNAGVNAKVRVVLRTGEKLKGRIQDITNESLTLQLLVNDTLESRQLDYAEIARLHKDELSTGSKVALGVGVGVAAAIGTLLIVAAVALRGF